MRTLSLLVFTVGAVILAVELSAARLLDPWFGNSQIVWTALIGLILLYLALGAWLGGRLADRFPSVQALLSLTSLAAVGVALIPAISPAALRLAAVGLADFLPGLLAGTLAGVMLLFSLPMILLGAVSPWAVRLAVTDLEQTGAVAGRLYGLSTAGSILGTFLPVLVLIPTFGTRWSFYILALILLLVSLVSGLILLGWRRWLLLPLIGILLTLGLAWATDTGQVRGNVGAERFGELIHEEESLYNYIAVWRWGTEYHLKLNEGVGIHSVHHPDIFLSQGIWDYFLLAPLFRPAPSSPQAEEAAWVRGEILVIGLAAGTVPALFDRVYGPQPITGVELDPRIIEVGRDFFQMKQPNLTPVAGDGRRWLMQQPPDRRFDLILVDAYRPPYIPFHLTTQEFFGLVAERLTEDGVVAINVGRTARNDALVQALSATLGRVFPSVHVVDEPGPADALGNSLLVATRSPTSLADFQSHVAHGIDALPPAFHAFARQSVAHARSLTPADWANAPLLTDDRAPVEQIVHAIILDFVMGGR